jgi:Peptidogalycan biosysnthesis/recognition
MAATGAPTTTFATCTSKPATTSLSSTAYKRGWKLWSREQAGVTLRYAFDPCFIFLCVLLYRFHIWCWYAICTRNSRLPHASSLTASEDPVQPPYPAASVPSLSCPAQPQFLRGFDPAVVNSVHLCVEPALHNAVGAFLRREREHIDESADYLLERSAVGKRAGTADPDPSHGGDARDEQ